RFHRDAAGVNEYGAAKISRNPEAHFGRTYNRGPSARRLAVNNWANFLIAEASYRSAAAGVEPFRRRNIESSGPQNTANFTSQGQHNVTVSTKVHISTG